MFVRDSRSVLNGPAHKPRLRRDRSGNASPRKTSRLLALVLKLVEYGRSLAITLKNPTSADLRDITSNFGTNDIARILACITRGLLRAAALGTRLAGRPENPPAAPAKLSNASRRASCAARSTDPTDTKLARLPTPDDIAAQVRSRPIGTVIADICRDLGIRPSSPLWEEIALLIIGNGGNVATLHRDINWRSYMWHCSLNGTKDPTRYVPAFLMSTTDPP